jgi:hypothetical protein
MRGSSRCAVGVAAALALALACWLGDVRHADACSCGPWPGTTEPIHPSNGAVDVPTNTEVLYVSFFGSGSIELVRESTGTPVPMAVRSWDRAWGNDRWRLGTPEEELVPNEAYLLVADGERVSRFVVGAGPDETPPAASDVELTVRRFANPDDCNSGLCWEGGDFLEYLAVEFDEPPADTVLVLMELSLLGADEPMFVTPVRWYEFFNGDRFAEHTCYTHPPELLAGETYCTRLVARDGAGNETRGDLVCSETETCAVDSCFGDVPPAVCEPTDWTPGGDAGPTDGNETGGCALGGAGAAPWLTLLLVVALRRRRR